MKRSYHPHNGRLRRDLQGWLGAEEAKLARDQALERLLFINTTSLPDHERPHGLLLRPRADVEDTAESNLCESALAPATLAHPREHALPSRRLDHSLCIPCRAQDLSSVTLLCDGQSSDATAPPNAVTLQAGKHHIVLDFRERDERDAWLRIWVNAVPSDAIPAEWADDARLASAALRAEFASQDEEVPPEASAVEGAATEPEASEPGACSARNSDRDVVKTGWLHKEGASLGSTWQERYFRLRSCGELEYFKNEAAVATGVPLGRIGLPGCAIFVPKSARKDYPHAFRLQVDPRLIQGSRHKYILSGRTLEESLAWQQALLKYAAPPTSVR